LTTPTQPEFLNLEEKTIAGTKFPALAFEMTRIREAEARLQEIQHVVPQSYRELDYTLGCCYRDSKNAILRINGRMLELTRLERRLHSQYVLEFKNQCVTEKMPKSTFTSKVLIDAFLEGREDYVSVRNEIENLGMLVTWFEEKTKVMDRATQMMRTTMRLYERAGNYDLPVR
jgi:hypothetical protein